MKIMSTSLNDHCHAETATVETWLNNMGGFLHQCLSPHMACFDYAAPNSPSSDKTQRYNDSDTNSGWHRNESLSWCVCIISNSQSLGFAKMALIHEPKDSVFPPPSLLYFHLLKGIVLSPWVTWTSFSVKTLSRIDGQWICPFPQVRHRFKT